MNYCGIDLAGLSSYVYITDKRGEKLHSGFVETSKESFAKLLKPYLRYGLKVAIEAGNQTAWVYETLVKLGAKVTVVAPVRRVPDTTTAVPPRTCPAATERPVTVGGMTTGGAV